MNKTAMIWGATGGIGRAIAAQLRQNGWTTVAVCRQPEQMEGLVDHAFAADVSR